MNKFYNTLPEEQETVINIDYAESKVIVYTSKKSVYERIQRKLGKPNRIYCVKDKISGAKWEIEFKNKKVITSVLSRPGLSKMLCKSDFLPIDNN